MVKNLPASGGDRREAGSVSALRRSPGEGNGYPLQDSCLENPKTGVGGLLYPHFELKLA